MNQQLLDYVKVYKGMLTTEECRSTLTQLINCEWKQHNFYSDSGLVDHGTEPYEYHGIIESKPVLDKAIWRSLNQYILEDMQFPWFSGWHGFSNIKFIKYEVGCEMKMHCDHIHSIYDGQHRGIPILSIIGALNDDYKGGEFMLFDDYEIKLDAGDVIIFPSVFLYPHRVNKIINGTRNSFVSWCS